MASSSFLCASLLDNRIFQNAQFESNELRDRLDRFFLLPLSSLLRTHVINIDRQASSAFNPRENIIDFLNNVELKNHPDDKFVWDEIISSISVTLSIFLQVNCCGPLVSRLSPSEKALEDRKQFSEELLVHTEQTQHISNSNWPEIIRYWQESFLGHPDDRVGESQSICLSDADLKILAEELEVDGEPISEAIRGVGYLWASIQLATSMRHFVETSRIKSLRALLPGLIILEGRISFVLQQCLASGRLALCPTLMDLSVERVSELFTMGKLLNHSISLFPTDLPVHAITVIEEHRKWEMKSVLSTPQAETFCKELSHTLKVTVLIEVCLRLIYYGRPEIAIDILKTVVAPLAGFQFEFDSVLGTRREYQVVAVPQLVLRIDPILNKSPVEVVEYPSSICDTIPNGINRELKHCDRFNKEVSLKELDPASDILESLKFDSPETSTTIAAITPATTVQQLILLAYASGLLHLTPSQDCVSHEQLRAVIERCLIGQMKESRMNYLIYSVCLWFRSQAEFHRSKTHHRALLQLQTLVDQFWDSTPTLGERLFFIFQLAYPIRPDATLALGRMMMDSGAALTACELFKDLWLWEEAAECLISANRKSLALELLETRLVNNPTPRILCCLGDIKEDPTYYEKAWVLSNKRYARAQRSLGKYWFERHQLKTAADCFQASLKISPMFEHIWYILGCCQMNLNEFDSALEAFSRVVALSFDAGEAWANMSAIHSQRQAWEEAFVCISEAIKHCRDNWRIWDNYIKISIKLKRPNDCISGTRMLLELGKKSVISDWIFGFLADTAIQFIHDQDATITTPVIRQICQFFDDIVLLHISDRISVFDCYARIASALENYKQEYDLRQKQLRTTIAGIPEAYDNDSVESKIAPEIHDAIQDILLSHRRWSLLDDVSNIERMQKTEELIRIITNLKQRLIDSKFPNRYILNELQDAIQLLTQQSSVD